MTSDYVDNWESLAAPLQEALTPILRDFDAAADLLFDRRLNLSFEAAVKELSIPGIVHLTEALRALGALLETCVTVDDPKLGTLLFDGDLPITAYDLPLYTPCIYLSQLAQAMDTDNVRVWKLATAQEIVGILLTMARCIRPDIEAARVCIAALHDMVYLYPDTQVLLQSAALQTNAAYIARTADQLVSKRM